MKNKLTSRFALALLAIAIVTYSIFFVIRLHPAHVGPISPTEVFHSSEGQFDITKPVKWVAQETAIGNRGDYEIFMEISNIKFPYSSPIITVAKKEVSQNTLPDIVEWGDSRICSLPAFRHIVQFNYDTQYTRGFLRVYAYNLGSQIFGERPYKCQDWYTVNRGYGYAFSFCAREEAWEQVSDLFLGMINSIRFED